MSDEDIWHLNRGGHDARKVYAAYQAAVQHRGHADRDPGQDRQGLRPGQERRGPDGRAPAEEARHRGAARSCAIASTSRCRTQDLDGSAVSQARRRTARRCATCRRAARRSAAICRCASRRAPPLTVPPLEAFRSILEGTGEREISTTMAFVRILTVLLKDKGIGKHIVPIVPDEARTFGMEGLFRQIGIYSSVGQLYTPVDAETLMSYREDKKGQMLEEGINEAGSTCSWIAAATSYANHGISMVPFYIYYSMFGFQRVGDFIWAAGDMRARGFLLGAHRRAHHAGRRGPAAPGRSQPAGGHHDSELPRLRSDLRLRAGGHHPGRHAAHVRRERERVLLHLGDERELRAAGAAGGRGGGHPQGRLPAAERRGTASCARRCSAAARSCASASRPRSCWRSSSACRPTSSRSPASANCGARRSSASAGICCIRPQPPRVPYVQTLLGEREGPLVAATDYVRNVPDQIRSWVTPAVRDARHRWLRAQRCARAAAPSTSKWIATSSRWRRSRRWPMPDSIDRKTRGRGDREARHRSRQGRSRSTADAARNRLGLERNSCARSGRLQGRGRHRRAGQARRHRQVDTPLLTLETEKATMDVPSTDAGVIEKLHVQQGRARLGRQPDRDAAGWPAPAEAPRRRQRASGRSRRRRDRWAQAATPRRRAAAPRRRASRRQPPQPRRRSGRRRGGAADAAAAPATPVDAAALPPVNEDGFARAHASPSVRRFARELGVDLARVKGTGQKGRITDDDVKAFVKSRDGARRRRGAGRWRRRLRCRRSRCRTSRSSARSRSSR